MELFDQIGNIELKIRQLIKKNNRLKQDRAALLEENHKLKEVLAKQQEKLSVFKDKLHLTQQEFEAVQGKSGMSTISRESMQKYFREMSQCVEWFMEQKL
jgi:regulator of replication initiation timing